jgi:hypothetical protein
MKLKPSKRCAVYGSVVLLLLFIAMAAVALRPKAPPSFPVPEPNGYDQLTEVARWVAAVARSVRPSSPRAGDAVWHRQWVGQCPGVTSLVRAALEFDCRVPIRLTRDYETNHVDDAARLKGLVSFLVVEAGLARADGQPGEALQDLLTAQRLAHAIQRGGRTLDFFVSISCQALVANEFARLIPSLDSDQCAEALAQIERGEREQEDPRVVMARERAWRDAVLGSAWRRAEWSRAAKEAWRKRSLTPFDWVTGRTAVEWQQRCAKTIIGPLKRQLRARQKEPG